MSDSHTDKHRVPRILVVDDQLINIRLLERKLTQNNMDVLSANSGQLAIAKALSEQPDVILLDIMMPGMDGIEVCRILKESPQTKDIPVIFVTARTSKEGKIEGLGAGAADYLIKPIDLDETIARVQTQIRIVESYRENLRLTRELEESRRQAAMMHLTEGIAHNLNNLLGVAVGYLSLLRRNVHQPDKITRHCDSLDSAIRRMTRIVQQLTIIGQFDSIVTERFALQTILHRAISRFHQMSATRFEVLIENALPRDFQLVTNCELLEASLERLLLNAYESYSIETPDTPAPEGGVTLAIDIDVDAEMLFFDVMDRGPGVPVNLRDNVFSPFVSSFSAVGKGMGLTIVQHSARSLNGSITLNDREGGGTVARFTHPTNLEIRTGVDDSNVQ